MNHIDRKLLNEMKNGIGYETNLPVYTTHMIHLEYEYSVILAALHSYTLAEVLTEDKDRLPEDVTELAKKVKQCMYDGLIADTACENTNEKTIATLDEVRNTIIGRMQILTAYTDMLQIYEYVLNRVEAGILGVVEDVDTEELSKTLYQYIFAQNDTMVINTKLQMITGQLPMRMTKDKFFDTVSQAFSIYNGSEKENFDEFVERIRGVVLLDKPKGYETEYPDIYETIDFLSKQNYEQLSKDELSDAEQKLTLAADKIRDIVTDYLMLTDVVNSVYAAALAAPYANVVGDTLTNSMDIIKGVYHTLQDEKGLSDDITQKLVSLEGVQEQLLEELSPYEGIFYEVQSFCEEAHTDTKEAEKLKMLSVVQQLHSNSVFIDIHKEHTDYKLADAAYIGSVSAHFAQDMTALFMNVTRPLKRAYMAAVVGQLPVIFNNTQEIQEYIHYSLSGCKNGSELTAVKKLLFDMMLE